MEGSITKIARFLNVELTPERVSEIASQTTFETMVSFDEMYQRHVLGLQYAFHRSSSAEEAEIDIHDTEPPSFIFSLD